MSSAALYVRDMKDVYHFVLLAFWRKLSWPHCWILGWPLLRPAGVFLGRAYGTRLVNY